MLEIEDEDGDGLDGVAGGFKDLQAHAGEVECVAVVHGDEGVLGDGAGAEVDGGAAAVAELEVAGDEVGVEVREEDVADLEAECVGVVEILLDVALRVDDDGGVSWLRRREDKRRGRGSRGSTVSGSCVFSGSPDNGLLITV